MPYLFEPITIRGITLRNRIGVSPMCTYSYRDGLSNEWQMIHLGARAVGGAGLIIAEAAAVEPRGRISSFDVGLWSDDQIEPLSRVTKQIKLYGSVAGIQIAHAGRKAGSSRPWNSAEDYMAADVSESQAVAPSPIAFSEKYPLPHELSVSEILAVQDVFRQAALRAFQAGFELLEIHAAHGYLIHSFYSPISNKRNDSYGGSFENRIRFLVETVRTVRPVWPDHLPLIVRISGTDWIEGGWTIGESVELARRLKSEGVDLIDCSSGGTAANAIIPTGPGYQVPISEAVRKEAHILTAAVGLITSPAHADEIIRNGRADLVLLGREMLRDPYWPIHAAQALKQPLPVPPQYLRGF